MSAYPEADWIRGRVQEDLDRIRERISYLKIELDNLEYAASIAQARLNEVEMMSHRLDTGKRSTGPFTGRCEGEH